MQYNLVWEKSSQKGTVRKVIYHDETLDRVQSMMVRFGSPKSKTVTFRLIYGTADEAEAGEGKELAVASYGRNDLWVKTGEGSFRPATAPQTI